MSRRKLGPYEKELKAASEALRLPKDAWQTERLATLNLMFRVARSKWAAGQSANAADEMITLMGEISAIRKSANLDAPRSIAVSIVQGVVGIYKCQHCGKQNELAHGTYTPAKSPSDTAPAQTPTKPAEAPSSDAPAAPAADGSHEPPANVVPLVTHREGVSASSFHSVVINGREVPPLKREQPSHYRSEAAERERHPYRDAAGGDRSVAHPLPVPHGVI